MNNTILKTLLLFVIAVVMGSSAFIYRLGDLNVRSENVNSNAFTIDQNLVPKYCVPSTASYEYSGSNLKIIKYATCPDGITPFEWNLTDDHRL